MSLWVLPAVFVGMASTAAVLLVVDLLAERNRCDGSGDRAFDVTGGLGSCPCCGERVQLVVSEHEWMGER